jgi:hypothetical protein
LTAVAGSASPKIAMPGVSVGSMMVITFASCSRLTPAPAV